jgi:hypothetical protein
MEGKKFFKRGSEYVEAAIVLPMIVLIVASFIFLTAYFYSSLKLQCRIQESLISEAGESERTLFKYKRKEQYSSLQVGLDKQILNHEIESYVYAIDEAAIIRMGSTYDELFKNEYF